MVEGACSCGAVAYRVDAEVRDVYVCHCSICRRSTGSNGIAVTVVENSSFRWLRGETDVTMWQKPDADWQSWFCRKCGGKVPGENDDAHMFIPVSTINRGGDKLKVAHHIFVGSKACWDVIGDSGIQHEEHLS